MSVYAILCGANDWNSIRLFVEHKEDWFRKHLSLPCGIPVAITFNRIFAALDPEEFRQIFIQWIRDVLSGLELSESRIVALDGKTVKGSAWNKGKDAISTRPYETEYFWPMSQVSLQGTATEA